MPIPFLCLALVWLLAYSPRLVVLAWFRATRTSYDNSNPRAQMTTLTGLPVRAQAAHQNTLEGFPPFAVAVLAAWLQGVRGGTFDQLAIAFTVIRVVYIGLYLADRTTWRSSVWWLGFLVTGALFCLPWVT